MQKGAFALIDCLGFKGIWERYDAETVIAKLLNIEKSLDEEIALPTTKLEVIKRGFVKPQIKLLSDTVAISLKVEENSLEIENPDPTLVGTMCILLTKILTYFAENEPHLLMRGCVTFGEHIAEKNFLIGRAVDEAAEYMDLANGAFVWLTPSADEKYKQYEQLFIDQFDRAVELTASQLNTDDEAQVNLYKQALSSTKQAGFPPVALVDYKMPIKNGERLICTVINPLSQIINAEDRKNIIKIYLKEMSSQKLDVIIKRQNTMAFLQSADDAVEQYNQSLENQLRTNFQPP